MLDLNARGYDIGYGSLLDFLGAIVRGILSDLHHYSLILDLLEFWWSIDYVRVFEDIGLCAGSLPVLLLGGDPSLLNNHYCGFMMGSRIISCSNVLIGRRKVLDLRDNWCWNYFRDFFHWNARRWNYFLGTFNDHDGVGVGNIGCIGFLLLGFLDLHILGDHGSIIDYDRRINGGSRRGLRGTMHDVRAIRTGLR